jgi:hypothetical protein
MQNSKSVLTELGPDVSEAGVPERHIKLIIAREEHSFLQAGTCRWFCWYERQKGAAVVGV